jgi:hypothetical protein
MKTKRERLEALLRDIEARVKDPCPWPTCDGVMGFWGEGPVMVVGIRPSTRQRWGPGDTRCMPRCFGTAPRTRTSPLRQITWAG